MPTFYVKKYRKVINSCDVADDLIGCLAIGDGVVVHLAHTPDYESGKAFELAGTLKVHHHAVDVVEVFVEVFDEKDLTVGIYVGRGVVEAV